MPTFSSAFDQTAYVGLGTSLTAFPNTSGVATTTGFKKLRYKTLTLDGNKELMEIDYKTGNRSLLPGAPGRANGTWSLECDLIPSGTAGTVPDVDPILVAIYGQAATIAAGVSATYALNDALKYLCFLMYDKTPGMTSPTNFYAFGCVVTDASINYNGQFLTMTVSGKCVFAANSTIFTALTGVDLPGAGGLTTFPAEPSVTTNGNPIASFGGSGTFDGNAVVGLAGGFSAKVSEGSDIPNDDFVSSYGTTAFGGQRKFMISGATFDNSDGSYLNTLKSVAFSKSPFSIALAITPGAGSNVTFVLNNAQTQSSGNYKDNGPRRQISFGDFVGAQTTSGALDDSTLAFT